MLPDEYFTRFKLLPPSEPPDIGPGWYQILEELLPNLRALGVTEIIQVKSKFGGLRVYVNVHSDDIYRAITLAEQASIHLCEQCGRTGFVRAVLKTLCERCHSKSLEAGREDGPNTTLRLPHR